MPTICDLSVSAPFVCQGLRCMAARPASDFRALDCCWTHGDTGCLLQEFCGAKHSQINPTRRLQTWHRQEMLATTRQLQIWLCARTGGSSVFREKPNIAQCFYGR